MVKRRGLLSHMAEKWLPHISSLVREAKVTLLRVGFLS